MSPVWGSTVIQPAVSFPIVYLGKNFCLILAGIRSKGKEHTRKGCPTYTRSFSWLESGSTAVTAPTQVPMGVFSSSQMSLTLALNTGGSLVSSTSMRTLTGGSRPAPGSPLMVSIFHRPEDVLSFTLQVVYGTSFSTEMDSCLCDASSKFKG